MRRLLWREDGSVFFNWPSTRVFITWPFGVSFARPSAGVFFTWSPLESSILDPLLKSSSLDPLLESPLLDPLLEYSSLDFLWSLLHLTLYWSLLVWVSPSLSYLQLTCLCLVWCNLCPVRWQRVINNGHYGHLP